MRARETARADALFRDPYAQQLAGAEGERRGRQLRNRVLFSAVPARTAVFDEFVLAGIETGASCVLNLGAGLDTRPYRLALPGGLRWVEADLPAVLGYKTDALRGQQPRCALERVPTDLTDAAQRRALLQRLDPDEPTFAFSEGLLVYLAEGDVASLAEDLAATPAVRWWALDLVDSGVTRRANRVTRSGALQFAAPDAGFFLRFGWAPVDVRSSWTERRRLGREPAAMRATWALSPRRVRDRMRGLGTFVVLARTTP